MTNELIIEAVVAPSERPVLDLAAERLGACLDVASGKRWSIRVRYLAALAEVGTAEPPPNFILVSLLTELERADTPLALIAARLHAFFESLPGQGAAIPFICTIFRHVTSVADRSEGSSPPTSIERIRRLNLLAAEISQATGVNVIDIDRSLAHVGARALETDYELGGSLGAGFAADTIVSTLLAAGFVELLSPEEEERAREIHVRESAADFGQALSVSATSLGFKTSRRAGVQQTFAPVQKRATVKELVRQVRHRRATVRSVAPIILGRLWARMPWRPK